MLTSWVRTGFFQEPLAQRHLCIQHVEHAEDQASVSGAVPEHCMSAPAASCQKLTPADHSMCEQPQRGFALNSLHPCVGLEHGWKAYAQWDPHVYKQGCGLAPEAADRQSKVSLQKQPLSEGLWQRWLLRSNHQQGPCPIPQSTRHTYATHVCMRLQLEAFLLVCAQTWRPQRMCLKVCGQPELLTYQDWVRWETKHTRSDQSLQVRNMLHTIQAETEQQMHMSACRASRHNFMLRLLHPVCFPPFLIWVASGLVLLPGGLHKRDLAQSAMLAESALPCSVVFPSRLTMDGGANGHNMFNTESVSWVAPSQATFLLPPCPERPADTAFCGSHPGTAPAWWTVCAH